MRRRVPAAKLVETMRLRFSIRDCLLVTAIVGLSLGWWIDRQRIAEQCQAAVAAAAQEKAWSKTVHELWDEALAANSALTDEILRLRVEFGIEDHEHRSGIPSLYLHPRP